MYKVILSILMMVPVVVFCEEKSDKNLPKTGRLAGTTSGAGQTAFDSDWGGLDLNAGKAPPISASIARVSEHDWVVKIFNNSKDKFKIQLKVVQTNRGKAVKSDTLSLDLAAGVAAERKVGAHSLANDAEVNLVKWNKKETKTKQDPEKLRELIAKKQAELDELKAQLPVDQE